MRSSSRQIAWLVRIERRRLGEADAKHRHLHSRDDGAKRRRQLRVGEERFEQARDKLDDLAIDGLARARDELGAVVGDAVARRPPRPRSLEHGLAQQLIESKQRRLERRAATGGVAAHRAECAGARRQRGTARVARREIGGFRDRAEEAAERSLPRRLDGRASERRR
jgi:hypothetical protein